MKKQSKLDLWADKHRRLFLLLILGAVVAESIAFLPGMAPEGCRNWRTMFSCASLPPFWSSEHLTSVGVYLAIIFGVPFVFARIRGRKPMPKQ